MGPSYCHALEGSGYIRFDIPSPICPLLYPFHTLVHCNTNTNIITPKPLYVFLGFNTLGIAMNIFLDIMSCLDLFTHILFS